MSAVFQRRTQRDSLLTGSASMFNKANTQTQRELAERLMGRFDHDLETFIGRVTKFADAKKVVAASELFGAFGANARGAAAAGKAGVFAGRASVSSSGSNLGTIISAADAIFAQLTTTTAGPSDTTGPTFGSSSGE